MNELKVFNSDLIPVYTTDTGEKVVIGRELHDALGIKSQYKDWFPRMADYGFSEGVDFNLLKNERVHKEGNRTVKRMVIDHILKFDMAKHICMIQRTETGKAIRQKLIDLEKAINGKDSFMIEDPIERAKVWIKEQEARKQLEMKNAVQLQQIQEMHPKAIFADAVAASSTSILIGDLAKILKQNGVEIGQKRLFSWLRDKGFLIKRKGADWNSPTQRAMEAGLFEIKETAFSHSDGHVTVTKTTKVTGKGQQYFINKFLGAVDQFENWTRTQED